MKRSELKQIIREVIEESNLIKTNDEFDETTLRTIFDKFFAKNIKPEGIIAKCLQYAFNNPLINVDWKFNPKGGPIYYRTDTDETLFSLEYKTPKEDFYNLIISYVNKENNK